MAQQIRPEDFDACLFDLDGVVTKTAAVHAKAWKRMFDEFLKARAEHDATDFVPFDIGSDYPEYVDGKPRYDGVRDFLKSRGIELPQGSPDDPPTAESICGLGNRKNTAFKAALKEEGVETYDGSLALIRHLRDVGIKTALVSSSANAKIILESCGITDLFDTIVDGHAVEDEGLAGKPAPDTYLRAAELLDTPPARAVVFEDAISGVQSGHAGHFGLVVGVDRVDHADELRVNGADVVSDDLAELIS